MRVRLLNDSETDTQVDLPSGKLSKGGERKPINKQKGFTCYLYAMRRVGFFEYTEQQLQAIEAFKKIKQELAQFDNSPACGKRLLQLGNQLCAQFNIDIDEAILTNESFMESFYRLCSKRMLNLSPIEFYLLLPPSNKWNVLYDILIKQVLAPVMHLKKSSWHPHDDFAGLQDSLKRDGAHFFVGKFGSWCYTQKPKPVTAETTLKRRVFSFDKASYVGDSSSFTHGIIVDQAKVVNGKQMIFFRDPQYQSSSGKPEIVFMLTYASFLRYLTDMQGYRANVCSSKMTFGMVSTEPEHLYEVIKKRPLT